MELRLLRYFTAVVQEGSITGAAQRLSVTQPTLSRQLMQLEEELDTELLDRSGRSVDLTQDGAMFYQRAMEILTLADKTENEFKNRSELIEGMIAIGATEAGSSLVLPELVGSFTRKYPNVRYELYSGYTDDIRERIDKGLLDIGMLTQPVDVAKYAYVELPQHDVWGILVRKDDPCAGRERGSFREILDRKLMIPFRETVRRDIESWFKSPLDIFATYNLVSNAALLVEKGLATALSLSSIVRFVNMETLSFVPFEETKSVASVLIWKKNYMYSPTVTRFIQMISDIYKT